jgi:MFS transporter, FSR family, fosmidomycin resistance protein
MAMNRRGIALMSSAHLTDDLYQGIVPALLPFLMAERQYSYSAVAGLVLASTVLSSVAQPLFGMWADKRPRRWMIWAGMMMAAVGVGLSGFFDDYALTWVVLALSGLGVAAFHPAAARAARVAAGNSNSGMSVFAVGGNLGFAVGSLIATPVILLLGLRGTGLLVLPALLMGVWLILRLRTVLDGRVGAPRTHTMPSGRDDWPSFIKLTGIVLVRSVLFFGVTSFIALYFIDDLGTTKVLGGVALTTFLTAGAIGTLVGGWLADRTGRMVSIRVGFVLTIPALGGLVLTDEWHVALIFVVLSGLGIFISFSVFVMLGQDYLPNRIGTASGVTVGLAVSVGGLSNPLLGYIADVAGLRTMLVVLIGLPVLALVLSAFLREPGVARPRPEVGEPTIS